MRCRYRSLQSDSGLRCFGFIEPPACSRRIDQRLVTPTPFRKLCTAPGELCGIRSGSRPRAHQFTSVALTARRVSARCCRPLWLPQPRSSAICGRTRRPGPAQRRSGQRVQRAAHTCSASLQHMRVDHRLGHVSMPQQFRNRSGTYRRGVMSCPVLCRPSPAPNLIPNSLPAPIWDRKPSPEIASPRLCVHTLSAQSGQYAERRSTRAAMDAHHAIRPSARQRNGGPGGTS